MDRPSASGWVAAPSVYQSADDGVDDEPLPAYTPGATVQAGENIMTIVCT